MSAIASPLSLGQDLTPTLFTRDALNSSSDDPRGEKKCDNIAAKITSKSLNVWDLLEMNKVLDELEDFVNRNLYYCAECRGQSTCDHKDDPQCDKGLHSQVLDDNHDEFRWDTALAIYAGLASHVTCDHLSTGTCAAVSCSQVQNSSQGLVLMAAANNLARFLYEVHEGFKAAHDLAGDQATSISKIFAPVPDKSGEKLANSIFMSIAGSLLGAIPGVGGQIAGAAFGVVNAANTNFQEQEAKEKESPADLGSTIAHLYNITMNALDETGDSIFSNANTSSQPNMIDLMRNGSLVSLQDSTTGADHNYIPELTTGFERAMFQQLAYLSWTQFFKDDERPFPVIAFAPGKCADLDYRSNASVPFPDMGLESLDVDITYNGSCYWLLNIQIDPTYENKCNKITTLNGGTRGALNAQSDVLAGLQLEDFIIPSVEGWLKNSRLNGFPLGNTGTSILGDPRAPGALNITVCDFMHSQEMPGDGCPVMWSYSENKNCPTQAPNTEPLNALIEDPFGTSWAPGTCKVEWWWYNEGGPLDNGLNPIPNSYQLQVNINDNDNRVAGNAAKQVYRTTWQIENSKLPYNLYVKLPEVHHDSPNPIEFWYADQHWLSNDNSQQRMCDEGKWDWEARHGKCLFPCPDPGQNGPKQHDVDQKQNIPGGWQSPISFGPAAVHHFDQIREQFRDPDRKWNPDPYPDADDTWCWVRTAEYWYDKDNVPSYQMQAYVGQGTDRNNLNSFLAADFNAQIPITEGYAEHIYGLRGELRVTFPPDPGANGQSQIDPQFDYRNGQTLLQWSTRASDKLPDWLKGCTLEVPWKWGKGLRQYWCNFKCNGPDYYTT